MVDMQTSFDDDQNETKYFSSPFYIKGLAELRNPWKESVLIILYKHLCFIQLQQIL
jgi:hypothetical protein